MFEKFCQLLVCFIHNFQFMTTINEIIFIIGETGFIFI